VQYVTFLRRTQLWLAVGVIAKLLAGQSGVRILAGKKYFLLHVSGAKLQGCQADHMHPISKLKMSGSTRELTLYVIMACDRCKFTLTFCRISEVQYILSLPYAEAQYRLLLPMQKPSTDCHDLCRSPVQTVMTYAEAQYRLSLPMQKPSTDCHDLCRSPVQVVITYAEARYRLSLPMQKSSTDCHYLCRSPVQTVITYAEVQYRLSLPMQKSSTDFSCEKYESNLFRMCICRC